MWKLQTILIPRSWGKKNANKYIKDGGYKLKFAGKPVDVTDNFFRYSRLGGASVRPIGNHALPGVASIGVRPWIMVCN